MPSSPAFTSSTAQTSSNPSFSSPAPPPPATTFNSPSLAAPNHSELRVRFLRFINSRVHVSQSLQAPIPPYLTASPQPSTWQTPSALSLSSAPCVPKPGAPDIRTAGLVAHHRAPGLHFPEADVEITAKTARFVERPRRRKLPIPPNYSLDPNIPPFPAKI